MQVVDKKIVEQKILKLWFAQQHYVSQLNLSLERCNSVFEGDIIYVRSKFIRIINWRLGK